LIVVVGFVANLDSFHIRCVVFYLCISCNGFGRMEQARMIKYFHELTREEFDKIIVETPMTWSECEELYPQPPWCEYPNAIEGDMGCWALMLHIRHNREDCLQCSFLKKGA
jgi:hypothetical protein